MGTATHVVAFAASKEMLDTCLSKAEILPWV